VLCEILEITDHAGVNIYEKIINPISTNEENRHANLNDYKSYNMAYNLFVLHCRCLIRVVLTSYLTYYFDRNPLLQILLPSTGSATCSYLKWSSS
jgi:hypothetical protein